MLGTIPFLMAIPPVAGVFIGRWLDGKAGTAPVFLIVFVILGFVAGVREVANVLKRANQDSDNDKKSKSPDR